MEPIVSVIVPTYNAAPYIHAALGSVLIQSLPEIEVLVIDDCSTDETARVVSEFRDSRVRLIRRSIRGGPSAARNAGIANGRGHWLAVLDADDWWHPRRLESLLRAAEFLAADVLCDDLYMIRDGEHEPFATYLSTRADELGTWPGPRQLSVASMIHDDYGYLKPVVRKDFVRRNGLAYRESLPFAEDFAFLLDCLVAGGRGFVVPEPYYYYRQHPGSFSKDPRFTWEYVYGLLGELSRSYGATELGKDGFRELRRRRRQLLPAVQAKHIKEAIRQRKYRRALLLFIRSPRVLLRVPSSTARRFHQARARRKAVAHGAR